MPSKETQPQRLPPFTSNAFWKAVNEHYDGPLQAAWKDVAQNGTPCPYWAANKELTAGKLKSKKWRLYFYMRFCVLEARQANSAHFDRLLAFVKKNKKAFAALLRDPSVKGEGERWGSGQHEWLPCHFIVEVLQRSADRVDGAECGAHRTRVDAEIDWLYVQAALRSPTKYLAFKNPSNTLRSGHCSTVKKNLNKPSFETAQPDKGKGKSLHALLDAAFKKSTTIAHFLRAVHNILRTEIYSGKYHLSRTKGTKLKQPHLYVVDGGRSNVRWHLTDFGRLVSTRCYHPTRTMLRTWRGDLSQVLISTVESDTSAELSSDHGSATVKLLADETTEDDISNSESSSGSAKDSGSEVRVTSIARLAPPGPLVRARSTSPGDPTADRDRGEEESRPPSPSTPSA